MCLLRPKSKRTKVPARNILLTNGRFPVALDLARQFKRAGHYVFVIDPMKFHVCKFSNAVKKSYKAPDPREDAAGYIDAVKMAVIDADIDLIVPLHEEVFYLAGSHEPKILDRLFAPSFNTLLQLHSKWELVQFLKSLHVDTPKTSLCRSRGDIQGLDRSKELCLKPVFGRAAKNVYHLKPGEPLPEDIEISEDDNYVCQEWVSGKRYCSYSVIRGGRIVAHSLYPVQDTIDGDSCVYFESVEHDGIFQYVSKVASGLGPHTSCQLAIDFIETQVGDNRNSHKRLVAVDCNPRATSGIHLFSVTPKLAQAFARTSKHDLESGHGVGGHDPYEIETTRESEPPVTARPGKTRQVAPGMMMVPVRASATWRQYFKHMYHLTTTKDVMFKWRDLLPTLMQPFLLTSYYVICREKGGIPLADMFQWDLIWIPTKAEVSPVLENGPERLR